MARQRRNINAPKKAPQEPEQQTPEQQFEALRQLLINDPGPLVLAISVDRITAKISVAVNGNQKDPEQDVELLLDALRQVERQLTQQIPKLVEERIERARKEQEGQAVPDDQDGPAD